MVPPVSARSERRLVHHRASAGVDQYGVRLHQRQRLRIHHVARGVGQRDVQGDDVGGLQQFAQEPEAGAHRVLGVLVQPHDVIVENVHAEALGDACNLLADVAKADDAERLAGELVEFLPHKLVAVPDADQVDLVLPDELLAHHEHQRERVRSATAIELAPPLLQMGTPARLAASISHVS